MKNLTPGLLLTLAFTLSACSTLQSNDTTTKLAVQYGTMKIIEQSDAVTADGVLRAVSKAREAANEEVRIIDVRERVLAAIDIQDFSPADQLLITTLVDQVQAELAMSVTNGLLSEDDMVRLETLLGWVEDAAIMAGGEQ